MASITVRTKFAALRSFAFVALCVLSAPIAFAQFDITPYYPSGVNSANVTPDQFTDAVFKAARENPSQAAEIASLSFESIVQAGRFTQLGGKQDTDPDGSQGDPTVEEWANLASDAAKRAAPDMAPQIDAAMASAVSSIQSAIASGAITPAGTDGGGATDGGGSGGGGPVAPAPIPGGGGGGGGSSTSSTSN
jgi:hypothetical protein